MSVNGLPVTQVQTEVTVTKTVILAEHQNKRLSQHHLQQQQKTANERSPDGTNRIVRNHLLEYIKSFPVI